MKKDIAEKWAEALMSNAYKQGHLQLRNLDDEFSCLGVLCNLHAIDHPKIAKTQTNRDSYLGASDRESI